MTERSFWNGLGDFITDLIAIRQRARIERGLSEELNRATQKEMHVRHKEEADKLRREVVYQADLGLSRIARFIEKAPSGVFVSVCLLEAMFDDIQVFPFNFLDLSYKRASTRLRSELQQITEASKKRISGTELTQIDQYLLVSMRAEEQSTKDLHEAASQYLGRICTQDKNGEPLDTNLITSLLPKELWQRLADARMSGVFKSE